MKVKYFFEFIRDDFFRVYGQCCSIGHVVFAPEIQKWMFKHYVIEEYIFVGDTREEAVENYYKFYGGM